MYGQQDIFLLKIFESFSRILLLSNNKLRADAVETRRGQPWLHHFQLLNNWSHFLRQQIKKEMITNANIFETMKLADGKIDQLEERVSKIKEQESKEEI